MPTKAPRKPKIIQPPPSYGKGGKMGKKKC